MSSSPTRSVGFARLAQTYDRLRPLDERWLQTVARMVELGDLRRRTILDVGCGTGRLAVVLAQRHGASVTGLDPSSEMLAVAQERAPSGRWVLGYAEALPFADRAFERAVSSLVIHHLDRGTAFPEVRRVLQPGGRFVISTADPVGFEAHWLAQLFPSFVEIERTRFPAAATLAGELRSAGFADIVVEGFEIPRRFSREFGLERLRGRYGSTFDLLSRDEYEAGLERAESELPDPVAYVDRWLLVVGSRS
jgi:ubiquinone/menaquinone biosynthesis C-methylase UbiE